MAQLVAEQKKSKEAEDNLAAEQKKGKGLVADLTFWLRKKDEGEEALAEEKTLHQQAVRVCALLQCIHCISIFIVTIAIPLTMQSHWNWHTSLQRKIPCCAA